MNFMTATVKVVGDDRKLRSTLKKAKAHALSVAKTMSKGFHAVTRVLRRVAIGVLAVTAAIGGAILKLTGIASAAEEIQAKFNTVFKQLAATANKWAGEFGLAVGRANQHVKDWMARLQDTFVPLGMTRIKAYELTKAIVTLSVDVASFNNKLDTDVMRDFVSALMGSTETVRKYGVIMGEVEMKAERLRQGIKTQYTQLSALEKVMLRYNIILGATKDAQGDAIRTGDSYANQVKRLKATILDVSETLGKIFLPGMTKNVAALNTWLLANKAIIAEFVETAVEKFMWMRARIEHMWDGMNWKDRFKGMGTAILEVLKATIVSAAILAKELIGVIASALTPGYSGKIWKQAEEGYKNLYGEKPTVTLKYALGRSRRYGEKGSEEAARMKQLAAEMSVRNRLKESGVFKAVGNIMKEGLSQAMEKVDDIAAGSSRKNYMRGVNKINARLQENLEILNKKYKSQGPLPIDFPETSEVKELKQQTMEQLQRLDELQSIATKLKEALQTPQERLKAFSDLLHEIVQKGLLTVTEARAAFKERKALLVPNKLKELAEELKERMITPKEKIATLGKDLYRAIKAGYLTMKEGLAAFNIEKNRLFGGEGDRAGAFSFERSLINWRGLVKADTDPMIQEQKITNDLLRKIERKKTLGI